MVALKTVCDRLFGWDREPDIQVMKLVRTSDQTQVKSYYQHWREGTEPPECTGAVNLALIATSPEELARLAKANQNNQNGVSATECNDQWVGPSVVTPEQPPAATHGRYG
jgi:hypothetical protein